MVEGTVHTRAWNRRVTAVYVWEVERGCICFSLESVRGGEEIFYIEIQRSGGCSIGLRPIFLSIE
jgi:hypothetical protein